MGALLQFPAGFLGFVLQFPLISAVTSAKPTHQYQERHCLPGFVHARMTSRRRALLPIYITDLCYGYVQSFQEHCVCIG